MKNAPFFADALTSAFGIRKPDRDPPDSRAFQPSMWPDFLASEPGRPVRVILIDDDPHIRDLLVFALLQRQLLIDSSHTLLPPESSLRALVRPNPSPEKSAARGRTTPRGV